MNRSYLCIVTRRGLEAIFREEEHVIRFLHRRLYRQRSCDGICCWAVMNDDVVRHIQLLIREADGLAALRTLQTHASHWGVSLPDAAEDSIYA